MIQKRARVRSWTECRKELQILAFDGEQDLARFGIAFPPSLILHLVGVDWFYILVLFWWSCEWRVWSYSRSNSGSVPTDGHSNQSNCSFTWNVKGRIPYFYITTIVYNTDLLMVCVWGLSLRPWGPSSKVSNLERWPFMLHFKILQCLVAKMPSICPTSNDFRNAPAGQLTFWQECHLPFGPDSSCGVTLYIEIQAQRDRYPLPALFCYDDQFFFSNP